MFKVQKNPSLNKTIRMPENLIDELEKIAKDNDVSFNKLVIQCCEYALKNMNTDKENTGDK